MPVQVISYHYDVIGTVTPLEMQRPTHVMIAIRPGKRTPQEALASRGHIPFLLNHGPGARRTGTDRAVRSHLNGAG